MNITSLRYIAAALIVSFSILPDCQAQSVKKHRAAIDQAAMQVRVKEPDESMVNFRGNVVGWLATRVKLSTTDEAILAAKRHERIQKKFGATPPSKAAAKIFERLVHTMPAAHKPFPYRLYITTAKKEPFTTGGGYIYLPKSHLSELQKHPAELAFHLARQLGHNARGHAGRANQYVLLKKELQKVFGELKTELAEQLFGAAFAGVEKIVPYLFLHQTKYRADLYAYHLCRNAGFDLQACTDTLRRTLLRNYPQYASQKDFYPTDVRGVLLLKRLKRLLMERDGLTTNDEFFGLFVYDLKTGERKRCPAKFIRGDKRTIVFMHGSRGGNGSFDTFLDFLAEHKSAADTTVLIFRFPNNASLARSGTFLKKEMSRVFVDARKASFVCHSSGGLVFRYYAEKRNGSFDRAVFLGTPHGGTDLTGLKTFVDVYEFAKAFKLPIATTIVATLNEGEGQIGHDLRPYSLFLQHLGADRKMAKRYTCIYGQYFNRTTSLSIQIAFVGVQKVLLDKVRDLEPELLAKFGTQFISDLKIPREVLDGDMVVSTDSAQLSGARSVRFRLNHQALKSDRGVFDEILKSLN